MLPRRLPATFALAAALAVPTQAAAHISLERGGTHMSRYGDAEIKDAPCGRLDGARSTNVYTYEPGETITVTIDEFIPHPGYFRIAFDDDGDDDFRDPLSIDPISRDCLADPLDQCGQADFYNDDTVLMDNLEPHTSGGGLRTFEVTLPEVECDNCTLQIIQVMEDAIHGPYNTSREDDPFYIEDVYHTCIDLVLSGGDATSPDAGSGGDPVTGGGSGGDGAAGGGGSSGDAAAGSGGSDAAPMSGAPAATAGTGGSDPAAAGNTPDDGLGGASDGTGPVMAGTDPPPAGAGMAAAGADGDDGGCGAAAAGSPRDGPPEALGLLLLAAAWLRRRRQPPA